MDYILKKIREQQAVHQSLDEKYEYISFLRIEFEYFCVFLLGYLWNKNFKHTKPEIRQDILKAISRPSIGDVVSICRKLDYSSEFFTKKKGGLALNDYTAIRNRHFGHGFPHSDGLQVVAETLEDLSKKLSDQPFLARDFDIILVTAVQDYIARGIKLTIDADELPWQCSTEVNNFEINNVYAKLRQESNLYYRLSPFILVRRKGPAFYLFNKMTNTLNGATTYNNVFASRNGRRLLAR